MYKDTRACLLHLGVEHPCMEKMHKLSMNATRSVSSILHARWEEEERIVNLANVFFAFMVTPNLGHAMSLCKKIVTRTWIKVLGFLGFLKP